jgi:hypothetical protein
MNSFKGLGWLFQLSTTLREEAQRYMGYESLPVRYLSLPFDTTIGSNLNLLPYDIGFLFLVFFPVYVLWYSRKSFIWILPFLFFFIAVSFPTALAAYQQIPLKDINFNTYEKLNLLNSAVFFTAQLFYPIALYFDDLFLQNIEASSKLTYLFLLSMASFMIYKVLDLKRVLSEGIAITSLFLIVVFLWIILSGGIPWYGFFIIPIGILIVIIGAKKVQIVYPFIFFTIFLWFFFRINGYYSKNGSHSFLVEAATIQYQIGVLDENKYQEILTKTPTQLIDFLNQNPNDKIYRNGTNLHYFIDNNQKRVFEDNQLGLFNLLNELFPDKVKIIRAMELSGIKYLIIDLNMANIDRTPEKTLLAKYENLIKVLYENPKLQLIYTDRIVRSNETGQPIQMMFDKGQQILNPGSLAVFMII